MIAVRLAFQHLMDQLYGPGNRAHSRLPRLYVELDFVAVRVVVSVRHFRAYDPQGGYPEEQGYWEQKSSFHGFIGFMAQLEAETLSGKIVVSGSIVLLTTFGFTC
jgi:hypothetical protein